MHVVFSTEHWWTNSSYSLNFSDLERAVETLRPLAECDKLTLGHSEPKDFTGASVTPVLRDGKYLYDISFFNDQHDGACGVYTEEDVRNLNLNH